MAAGQIREGGSHEREYKSKGNKKSKERCERGEREENRRGSTSRTAGPGSRRSSSGSGRTVNVILSSRLLEMQQPKLYSNLTFQKHRLIQPSFLSLLLHAPPITFFPLCPSPSVLFYLLRLFLSHFQSS